MIPPPSLIQCYLYVAKCSWKHYTTLFWGGGSNRLTNEGKRYKIEGIGGYKGQFVNNFVLNSKCWLAENKALQVETQFRSPQLVFARHLFYLSST